MTKDEFHTLMAANNLLAIGEEVWRMAQIVELHCKRLYGKPEDLYAVPELLAQAGYRKCAEGQKTTQYCALAEQARREEREEIIQLLWKTPKPEDEYDHPVSAYEKAIRARGSNATQA